MYSFNEFILNEMAIRPREEKYQPRKIEIDLNGPEGNAFHLIGLAKKLYPKIHPDKMEDWKKEAAEIYDATGLEFPSPVEQLVDDMMSSDYEYLIKIFDEEFGDYVDLFR